MDDSPLDTVRPATWRRRVAGFLIDVVVMTGVYLVVGWTGGVITTGVGHAVEAEAMVGEEMPRVIAIGLILSIGAGLVAAFCCRWLPHARSGQTLGKRLLGIRLVSLRTGDPPSKRGSFGRELVLVLLNQATCGFGLVIDMLWPLWDRNGQTVHDKVAKTVVIEM